MIQVEQDVVKSSRDLYKSLKIFTRLCLILSAGLLIYILVNIFTDSPDRSFKASLDEKEMTTKELLTESFILPRVIEFSEYTEIIKARDIFNPPYDKEVAPPPSQEISKPEQVPVPDLTQQYKLVGILVDNKPVAIIEDLRSKETLFLSQGEHFGEAVLEEIKEGKVVISFQNQRLELTP